MSGIRATFLQLPASMKIGAGIALVAILFVADFLTGSEISFSIFYLIPVVLTASVAGRSAAVVISVCSGLAWLLADFIGGAHYSQTWIPIWNMLMRITIFILVAQLLIRLIAERERAAHAEIAAQQATQAKSDFLANISHEIRTPLNALLGVAQLLEETELTARQREFTRIFRAEGEQLRRLINDVLDLSKVEAGKFQLEFKSFHLGQMTRAMVQTYSPAAAEKGLQLEDVIAPDADRVWLGDPHRLRQVLANLLGNAIKFTKAGRIVLRIDAGISRDGATPIRFSVEDTGIGIDLAKQPQLFRRYEQLANSAASLTAGTGLGLSISRALVNAMGGDLEFESQPGRGSTFYFSLPLAPGTAATESPLPTSPAADETTRLDGITVLLVEDYTVNQLIFAEYLKSAGCRVTLATNGREGVQRFSTGMFDLVLMDMQMPVLDGWSATREIRAWERLQGRPATPIIALTASALNEDRERCREAGCTHFLPKPLTKIELLRAATEVLGHGEKNTANPNITAVPASLRAMFLDDTRHALAGLREAIAVGDWSQIGRLGHQLTGSGTTFGFPEITAIGRAFEAAVSERSNAHFRELADKLETFLSTPFPP